MPMPLFPGDLQGQEENSPILQGAPLCPGGHTQAPVSGWHLSPKPHWHGWEQLAPNIPGAQPGREPRRKAGIRGGRDTGLGLAWGAGARSSASVGTFQAEVSSPAWGAKAASILGVAGPAVVTLAGLGAAVSPASWRARCGRQGVPVWGASPALLGTHQMSSGPQPHRNLPRSAGLSPQ